MSSVDMPDRQVREVGAALTVDATTADQTAWTTIGLPAVSGPAHVAWSVSARRLVTVGDPGAPKAGDYELQEIIGEGGMGVVYAARQTALGRLVALKRMRRQDAGAEDRSRFLAEAAVSGRLDHQNIVPIHDVGIDEHGVPFYTMKRVLGRPWREALRTLSEDENLDILLRVADAVAFAHDHGVVHRDLKPDNVMLGAYGEVLLADWGLACDIAELQSHLRLGAAGTPAYMAPEMAWGEAKLIGPRSDIYLLGAILYEILTSEPPHPGRTVREAIESAGGNRIEPAIPAGELGAIAARAMAMQPEDRFPTVQAFQQALREYRTHADSDRLAREADDLLKRARAGAGYPAYARALHAFEEALLLWPGNRHAAVRVRATRSDYASAAIDNGDLDLADSLINPVDPEQLQLVTRLRREQHLRRRTRRRITVLTWLSGVLGVLTLVILGVSLSVVALQYHQVVRASHERDDAEARLLREEASQHRPDDRVWRSTHSDDFSTADQVLPLLLDPTDWVVADGVLRAIRDHAGLILPEPPHGELRLQFDLAATEPVSVILGVPAQDRRTLSDIGTCRIDLSGECRVSIAGRQVAAAAMPPAVADLFPRVRIVVEGDSLRVLINGHEILRTRVSVPSLERETVVVLRAQRGASLDNLRLDRLR